MIERKKRETKKKNKNKLCKQTLCKLNYKLPMPMRWMHMNTHLLKRCIFEKLENCLCCIICYLFVRVSCTGRAEDVEVVLWKIQRTLGHALAQHSMLVLAG